jgi:thiosulfate/3-mercaptopyruvate sulfurtransferase
MQELQGLISTTQLASALGQPDLRVYDCTTYLEPAAAQSEDPYDVVSGVSTFEEAHLPGADYLDLQGEFSDPTTRLRFMMANTQQLATAFGRHGIGEGIRVVLYSIGTMMWATRFWWMLRSLGFDDVAVLDGGFDKWRSEGLPVEHGRAKGYAPTRFHAMERPGLFVDKSAVLAALADPSTVIVNALSPQFHKGQGPSRYGRAGRIPGSVNVPAATLVDTQAKHVTTLGDAAAKFEAQGVTKDKRTICYCGGGISATVDLFMLWRLGYPNLTLYDGSMGEWAKDHALPMESN